MAKKDVWSMNFAKNPKIAERVAEQLVPKMRTVRAARAVLEEDLIRWFFMWNVTKDEFHQYKGRAQLYIPEVRKAVEAQARQFTQAAFPQDDFFDCVPSPTGTLSGAKLQKQVRSWQIEQCQLRTKYHVFARQMALYGTSPAFIPWREDLQRAFRSAKVKGKIGAIRENVEIYRGPDFIPVDLLKWFFLDPTKTEVNEGGCFEHKVMSHSDLVKKEKAGDLINLDEIEKGNSDAFTKEELYRDIQRFEAQGLLVTGQGYAGEATFRKDDEEGKGTHLCSTVFVKAILPEACEEDEDPDSPIPVMVQIYDNEHVGLVKRNPFWHQRVPYIVGRYISPNPDEAYGQGIPKAIQYMQYEINSKVEQAMDSATLANNPIAIVDPGLAANTNEFPVEPGAIWWASPTGVKLTAIPDTSAIGYQAMSIIKANMQDYSDRSPTLPSELSGKSRTATQAGFVNASMSVDTTAFQKQNEVEVLQPLMEMWESLTDQNETDDQMVMVAGARAGNWKNKLVTKDQTLGRYRYFWKVTSQVQNRQVLARQMMDAIKVATMVKQVNPQFPFDFGQAYSILYKEGWNLPDSDKVLGDPSQVEPQDPELEARMAALGMSIDVAPEDDDPRHMQSHDKQIADPKTPPHAKEALAIHNLGHQAQAEKKQQVQQQQQQQMMMQMQMAQQQQGGKGKQSVASGDRTQMSPNANGADIASGGRQ